MGYGIKGLAVMRPIVGFGLALGFAGLAFAEDGKRQIEEVVVTAEKSNPRFPIRQFRLQHFRKMRSRT